MNATTYEMKSFLSYARAWKDLRPRQLSTNSLRMSNQRCSKNYRRSKMKMSVSSTPRGGRASSIRSLKEMDHTEGLLVAWQGQIRSHRLPPEDLGRPPSQGRHQSRRSS